MKESLLSKKTFGVPPHEAQPSILVVEDEHIVALDLVQSLRQFGYRVTGPVDTGERAIETALSCSPDLVLMDIRLRGEMDGITAAQRIAEATEAPVVFLTAHADAATLERAKSAAPYSYLIKPFRHDEVRCAVEVSLHRRKLMGELRAREREIEQLNAELERRVTERTAALTAANNELEAFSYSIAHDLRSPLRGIQGFTSLVLERHAQQLGPIGCNHLERVRQAAQRMSQLIDDLLRLAHVVQTECAREIVDLAQLAREIDSELRAVHSDREVRFSHSPDLRALGDPTLIRVILHNLLSNAWKFTAQAPAPHIEFGSQAMEGSRVFFVRDNGVGFEMSSAEKLFGVFTRLHSQTSFPGNGIGLAIVQRAVQRHAGRIWATAAPDAGATFYFTLNSED